MSTTIDQRVVEMRFDNRHFEKNVQGTMSTLDKLKAKLNLKGAAKGLENINTSANKVNMKGMSSALTDVSSKFSALEIMGVTALANITNSAVNAGKRIVSALTIDPIRDGWNEYEMTLNAVQTTMAGTGKTAAEVEKELKKLDEYADKTVYSTADMLNNLPKFTNAGVELKDATKAMIGIANATALAGGDAGKASIAFYNLGQAIGTGYLTRMDYNSINNAGIATMEWKNQMVEAAIAAGTLKKVGEDSYKAGSKTLTLQQLFIDGLQEQWATTEVMMKVFGDYGDETTKIGTKAYAAAQDIKTFSQMMESLKATAGTGWKDTWQIIFGGLDEAKEFWTGLTNFISKIITGMADFRNKLLEGALGRSFKGLFDNINKPFKAIEKTIKTTKDYAKVVDEIISGKWGNYEKRWNALTKAGYDWKHAQNLVNEELGFSLRRATDYKETQKEVVKTQEKVNEATAKQIIELIKLSDAELKAKGYTDEQIKSFRELEKVSRQTGIPLKEFIENIDKIDGRWILINSFKNAGQGLVAVFKAIKDAWVETIGVMTSDHLFNAIAALHKFSTYLVVGDETADKLKRTLKGVFAILDMMFTLIGGPIKIAVKILFQFLQALDIIPHDILGMTATIGDAIVAFHDWLDSVLDFTGVFKFLAPYIKDAAGAVRDWFKGLGKSEALVKFTKFLKNSKEAIVDWFKGLKETDNIAKYIFEGLVKGLSTGAKGVIDFVINLGKQILTGIKKVLGIHSPSTEFFEIGKNIVQGLFNGVSSMVKMVYSLFMSIGGKLIDIVKSLDLGSIFTIAMGAGSIYAFVKIAKAIDTLTSPLESLDALLFQGSKVLKTFRGVLNSFKFKIIAESMKTMATAIAILAGSIVVLTMVDQGKMWSAVGAITVLMALLAGLTAIAGKFGDGKGLEFGKIALTLLGLGVAMALMAKSLKTIAGIDTNKALQAIGGFVVLIGSMIGMMAVVSKNKTGFAKLGSAFLGLASGLLMMAIVAKILGGMDQSALIQGGIAIAAFSLIIVGLMAATKLLTGSQNVDKIGKSISKIASAILIMMVVAKIAGNMDRKELIQGGLAIVAFGGIIVGLMAATKLISGSKNVGKIGSAIFGISAALLMMTFVAKIAAGMEPADFAKGVLAITAFGGIIVGLMAATKLISGSKNVGKIGKTILMLSVSIGLMAITATLLSLIDLAGLAKGIVAVGLLSAMVGGLVYATKYAKNVTGTIGVITAAIAVLAISIGVLSMIKPEKLASASLSLSLVLGIFSLVVKASGAVKKAMGTIAVLTVAIAALAGALYLLGQLPADRVLASSTALSLLLGAMGGVMTLLSSFGGASGQALLGVLGMVALCAPLYLMVDILSKMQNIQNASANAIALGSFMGVLAVVQLLCAVAGSIYTATGGMAMTGILGMVGLVATLYLLMGALAIMSNIPNAISNLEALKTFILTMTGVLVALAIVGPLAMVGVQALGALVGLMAVIGAFAVAVGFLMDKIPSLQGFLDTGVSVLIRVAEGIGKIIGAFAGGLLTGLTSGLPQVGTNLSMFMTNAMPFINGAKMIDQKMMNGVKALAETILILTGANILESLTSWLTGGNSLAEFGSQLGGLGTHLSTFVANLGAFSESQVTTVTCACNAIKAIAQAADQIPNEGGLAAFFAGENSISAFAQKLPGLGTHLSTFVANLGTFTEAQVTAVDCAGKAIVALAQAADQIPNEGGLAGLFAGENDIGVFGAKLPGLGTQLNQFVTNLGTFSDAQVTTVDCAGKAIVALSKAASQIPNDGGLAGLFAGENDISVFGKKLPGLAKNISSFVSNLGTFSEAQVSTVNSACKAIQSIAKLGQIDIKDTGKGLNSFGKNMVDFAKKVKSFVQQISEVGSGSIDSAVSKTKSLIDMATKVASINIESLKTFGNSLKKVAKDGVKGFVKEFSGASPKDEAKKATKALLKAAIDGAEDKKSDVKKKFKSIAEAAVDVMCTKALKSDAEQAGKDLVKGFANGIKNNKSLATNAGSALGRAALNAAKKALDEHSPSKEAEKVGNFFGQGLVIGIKDYETKTYNAGYGIADRAKEGLSRAISKVSDLISNGVDAQPMIRPVLDLSDVENGAGYLNTLFNNGPAIGVEANLKAISSGMNSRSQNGTNNDIVSAINKLSKNLGNVGGDTYNLNGITYDDGSNLTDAVSAIVRAAKIERRT